MRWVLIVLVSLLLLAIWVASIIWPELRWIAELATFAVVLLVLCIVLFRWLRVRLKAASLERELTKRAAEHERPEVVALRSEMRRAVQALRRGRPGGKGGRAALYSLPWYVIVGPPATGKTTALERSGLSFISNESGAPKIRGTAGTRNCDWWFSHEAILLDTAGRFATSAEDRVEWLAFLDTLRKLRPGRPLDGLMVAVSATDIVSATNAERDELAGKLRARLDEVLERLGLVLPVYLLLTKADLVAGFVEFWSDLGKPERAQVWGASFEVGDPRLADPAQAVQGEFELLSARVHERLLDRLPAERSPDRRARIMQFPLELRSLSAPLALFVEALCRPAEGGESPLFRGFYLTSGTQVGKPMERVLTGMARGFALKSPAVSQSADEVQSYFLTDVFRSIILPDRHIGVQSAATTRRRSRRELVFALGALGVAAFVLIPAVASYVHNMRVADDVHRVAEAAARADSATSPGTVDDPLEVLRDNVDRVNQEASGFGIGGWFGPRAARELQPLLRRAYIGRMDAALRGRTRAELEKAIAAIARASRLEDSPDSPNDHSPLREAYDTVKLSSTLVDPEGHVDASFTPIRLARVWLGTIKGANPVAEERLSQHAAAYLAALQADPTLRWTASPSLEGARRNLRDRSISELPLHWALRRAYGQPPLLCSDIVDALSAPYVKCPADNVLVRGMFTANGWKKVREALDATDPWPREAIVESWVTGESRGGDDQAALRTQLRAQYYEQYSSEWLRLLDKCVVAHPKDFPSAKDELTALKDAKAFYKLLFAEFKTNQIADQRRESFLPPISTEGCLSRTPWAKAEATDAGAPPSPVQKSFRPLLVFSGDEGKVDPAAAAPLDKYRVILETLRALLESAGEMKPAELKTQFAIARRGVDALLDGIEEPIRGKLLKLLMPPVAGAVEVGPRPGVDTASAEWKATVWTGLHDQLLERFPFNKSPRVHEAASFADLTALLQPDSGILWTFVRSRLGDWVEPGAGKYIAKPGADRLSPDLLTCLSVAQEITDAFFTPGEERGLKFGLLADWSAPDVTEAKFAAGSKVTPLGKGDWSGPIKWAGEDVRIEWLQGGHRTQALGRNSFSLFDLFVQLGLKPGGVRGTYAMESPPLTVKVRSEGRVDPFRADFFSRWTCPPELRMIGL